MSGFSFAPSEVFFLKSPGENFHEAPESGFFSLSVLHLFLSAFCFYPLFLKDIFIDITDLFK